jgi:hypothetical protein
VAAKLPVFFFPAAGCWEDSPYNEAMTKPGLGFPNILDSPNINVLAAEKLSGLGNSATLYSVLVEVESAKSFP